jgi:hypothetical protein
MFGNIEPQKEERKYTTKIESPIYEPKNQKPHILELYDNQKTKRLVREIDQSSLPIEEKMFLVDAARRHTIFNYEKIADYYANASPEMQSFMEKSALVIIDFEKAIEYGYVKMCDDIRTQYLEEYGD